MGRPSRMDSDLSAENERFHYDMNQDEGIEIYLNTAHKRSKTIYSLEKMTSKKNISTIACFYVKWFIWEKTPE